MEQIANHHDFDQSVVNLVQGLPKGVTFGHLYVFGLRNKLDQIRILFQLVNFIYLQLQKTNYIQISWMMKFESMVTMLLAETVTGMLEVFSYMSKINGLYPTHKSTTILKCYLYNIILEF